MKYQFEYLIKKIDSKNANLYQNLTYPSFKDRLVNLDKDTISIGIQLENEPIGLGMAEITNQIKGNILSLFIIPEYRGKGLGKKLLQEIEQAIYSQGCQELNLVYTENKTTPALEKILNNCHWNTPELRMLIGVSECMRLDYPGLVETIETYLNRAPLPREFSLFPWQELRRSEKEAITQQKNFNYPEILYPFKEEEMIEYSNSIGMRYQNQVVGWIVNHRIREDTIRYTSFFIRKDLQKVGRTIPSISLLLTAFLYQVKTNQAPKAIFTVEVNNNPMIRFVKRRIAPFLSSMKYSKISSKILA